MSLTVGRPSVRPSTVTPRPPARRVCGTSFICRGIQFFDGSEWSHAALYLGNSRVGEAIASGLARRDVMIGIDDNVRVHGRQLKELALTPNLFLRGALK